MSVHVYFDDEQSCIVTRLLMKCESLKDFMNLPNCYESGDLLFEKGCFHTENKYAYYYAKGSPFVSTEKETSHKLTFYDKETQSWVPINLKSFV